jgi:peptidoglycan hydrolase CwlO-like protein
MQGFYQRDSIVRTVALICEDLENRCENVEQPLRREQDMVKDLTAKVSQLQEQLQSLETEAMDRRNCLDGLEAEMGDLENERDDLLTKLDNLELELSNVNKQANESLRAAQESFNAKDSQYRSIILTHEENLHSCRQEIDKLNADTKQLEAKAQKSHEDSNTTNQLHEALQVKFSTTDSELQGERQITTRQNQEISQLRHFVDDLEKRLSSTTTELTSTSNQRNELQMQYEELVRSSEENLQVMEARYESDIKAVSAKANEDYDALSIKLNDARLSEQEVRNSYEDARRDLQFRQSTNEQLEEKIQQLTDTCAEKDDELFELRSLRSKVLASVGLAASNSLPIRTGVHDAGTSRKHLRRQSTVQPQDLQAPPATAGTNGVTNADMENIANASFTSSDSSRNGSTPKRPKPRPSFKVPTIRTPNHSKTSLPSRPVPQKLSLTKRTPLRAVSPNRRHTTVGFVTSEMEDHDDKVERGKGKGGLHTIEYGSFDMDGFLEGTPFTPGMFDHSTGRMPEDTEETTEL